jgi:uncharacterized membrane protein
MLPPADDRMDALTDAIVSLRRRMDSIERRLARLEPEPAPAPVEPPPLPPPAPAMPVDAAEAEPTPQPEPRPAPGTEPESPRELETRVGLTWLNRVGVVTLVLGVAFFFKYAVDNQWIGEAGRVLLGILAGFATLGFGEYVWRRGHRLYAHGITAAGVAILYLSFYASFQLYRLVPQGVAFALMALTTAMAGAVAIHYGAMAIAILGLVGGFLTPVMLSTNVDRPWALFTYILLLDLGALAVARARRWRPLEWVALAGTAILYLSWFADRFNGQKQTVATFFALVYYVLFVAADSPAALAVAQILTNLAVMSIWGPQSTTGLWLALALAAGGLAVAEKRARAAGQAVVFGVFWSACALWHAAAWKPHIGESLLVFTAGFLLFLGWTAWRLLVKRFETRSQDLAFVAINGAAYFGLCYHMLDPGYHAYMGLFAAALAGIHLALGSRMWNTQPEDRRDVRPVLLLIGVALTFLTLAAPIQFSSYRITMAWAVEAAAMTWIGMRTGARRLVYAALVVFTLVLMRLWIVDSWIYQSANAYRPIANARFLTFLTAAVSLWLGARWIKDGVTALAPYVAGHFVLLWALGLEVTGWVERTAAAANVQNADMVSVSALMAAYGVALVLLGVLTRMGINRMLGLGLLAVVVAKLYLYDVWQLGRVYRIIAFSFLGVLLLVTSYVYSHYRAKIESWWRDEKGGS